MSTLRPLRLELREKNTLIIKWSDHSTREYNARDLREACPCATCREKNKSPTTASPLSLTVLSTEEALHITIHGVQPIGNYAFAIDFSDGHNTGIFTLAQLLTMHEASK